jgi:hypothetical protein
VEVIAQSLLAAQAVLRRELNGFDNFNKRLHATARRNPGARLLLRLPLKVADRPIDILSSPKPGDD